MDNPVSVYLDEEEQSTSPPKPPKSFSETLKINSAMYNKLKR
jgi:hypothetical protein